MMSTDYRRLLLDMFHAAVNAAAPALCVPGHLPPRPKGRTIVVGAGKAAGSKAAPGEAHSDRPTDRMGVTALRRGIPDKFVQGGKAPPTGPRELGTRGA